MSKTFEKFLKNLTRLKKPRQEDSMPRIPESEKNSKKTGSQV
jgi:hypothetical protein